MFNPTPIYIPHPPSQEYLKARQRARIVQCIGVAYIARGIYGIATDCSAMDFSRIVVGVILTTIATDYYKGVGNVEKFYLDNAPLANRVTPLPCDTKRAFEAATQGLLLQNTYREFVAATTQNYTEYTAHLVPPKR